jgi:hypothetical protein
MMISKNELPVAVIGAGPVGLAAAAHLVARNLRPIVFEKGESVGAALLSWGHVRVFSPWKYNVDDAARTLLERKGWKAPAPDYLPSGREIVEDYLLPLASVPEIASGLKLGAAVLAVARDGLDKVSSAKRDNTPFVVRYADADGEHDVVVQAVIDASGTWSQPNPIGLNGLPVPGEVTSSDLVSYGIPDVIGSRREDYLGKRTLVVGSGHSAINVALALMELRLSDPKTEVLWALRHHGVERLLGGGLNDQLPERGALGLAAKKAMDDGRLQMLTSYSGRTIVRDRDRLVVGSIIDGAPRDIEVDRVVVTTGFRPDFSFLRELRIDIDPTVEAPPALAPLIDPNVHSCGTVPPHGVEELKHPEKDFFIVGSKSYGRAPTFLMKTGYEQVRSVVAEIAGDHVAARQVQLVLPETGVCSADPGGESAAPCCGGAAPETVDACCVADAVAKVEGKSGCGCGSKAEKSVRVIEGA